MKKSIYFFLFLLVLQNIGCSKSFTPEILMSYTIDQFDTAQEEMVISIKIKNNSSTNFNGRFWELHWNQMKGFIDEKSLPEGIGFEWINGAHYFVLKFNEQWNLPAGQQIQFTMKQKGIMDRIAMGPVGVFVVQEDQAMEVSTEILWEEAQGLDSLGIPTAKDRYLALEGIEKMEKNNLDWIIPNPLSFKFSGNYRKGDQFWNIDLDPQFTKDKSRLQAFFDASFDIAYTWEKSDTYNFLIRHDASLPKEAYRLNIQNNAIVLHVGQYPGLVYGLTSLRQIISTAAMEHLQWPLLKIYDSPRFGYRGFLLDIARNFFGPDKIKQVLDLMALFKLNHLDFRLTDDEGWRIEISSLPELTSVGSKRGYSPKKQDRLIPMYGSGADGGLTGNGYLDRTSFISLLKYAHQRAIKIIPQISFPSHARAAIKSMDYRYIKLMEEGKMAEAETFLLSDPNDKSSYRSAQNYNDNIICICNESAYRFYEKVVDEMVAMYREAEVPLEIFSIGADELPYGVWTASPICQKFLATNDLGISDLEGLYLYNLKRLKSILDQRNIAMAGWEDILLDHSEKSQEETKIKSEHFNYQPIPFVWNSSWGGGREDMIYKFANMGFKTVMSNSSAFYFDMTDDKDMENHGLNWSGYVEYKDTWGTDPENVFANLSLNNKHGITPQYIAQKEKLMHSKKNNLLGIQSQLWTETVRSESIFDELLMPNLIVFSERAWSPRPDWLDINSASGQSIAMNHQWNTFANTLGQRTLPMVNFLYKKMAYDLPKPGAVIENDSLKVRISFPGLEVRYTTNGKIPDHQAQPYKMPIPVGEHKTIKLRTFDVNGRGGRPISINKKKQ